MKNTKIVTILALLFFANQTFARESILTDISNAWNTRSQSAPTSSEIEIGFSPGGTAEALVLKAINASRSSICVLAYSFTSKPIAMALIAAHKRGVNVQVVVDKSQRTEKYTSATFLANMGIPVRVDSMHAIQHNKVLVIDQKHIETGSFNYTAAATKRNAENALVVWNNSELAKAYQANWQEHWQHSETYQANY
jgi:phosphatidylserine/phosphatidylglycerophosphate/cardiolipin synthase-like enzyme